MEIGLFSRRNLKKLYIFWWISETGILTGQHKNYLFNGYFEIIGTEIGNHTPLEPPVICLLKNAGQLKIDVQVSA